MSQNQGNNFQDFVSHFSTVITRLIWQENGTFFGEKKKNSFFCAKSFSLCKSTKSSFFSEKRLIFFPWKRPKF